MFEVPLATSSTCLSTAAFWESVLLYHNRSHLINRKIIAVSQVLFYKIDFTSKCHVSELFTRASILYEVGKLKRLAKEEITEDFIRNIVECYDKKVVLSKYNIQNFKEEHNGVFISVRILLPRSHKLKSCIEVVTLDKDKNLAIFFAVNQYETVLAPPFCFEVELTPQSNLRINLSNFEDADTTSAAFLADKLFPKLLKWAESNLENNDSGSSLSLISVDDYCLTYNNLKTKYGDDMIKEWTQRTSTDPQKFVFEDLAIASYLICLWRKYADEKVRFVDCGCGNGLLVYILNQEGYCGYGIDIRRRPTWDIYPQNTKLEVGTVTPSSRFPDCTWIIGNHSDELTPWIPVLSLKSSPRTNFFIIPCCPFDFSGRRYIRNNTSISQYSDYLSYIHNICVMGGFNIETDKLRIPSTKRICLVGIRNKYNDEKLNQIDIKINNFIVGRLASYAFKPRCEIEKVRNCTQLDRGLIQKLISICISNLLLEENYIQKSNGEKWNKGTTLTLSDLSKIIPTEDLKQLKNECGGLQTLLRNHRYLFEMLERGKVRLREPLLLSKDTMKYKNKPCWFLRHHPNGCLYSTETCAYQH